MHDIYHFTSNKASEPEHKTIKPQVHTNQKKEKQKLPNKPSAPKHRNSQFQRPLRTLPQRRAHLPRVIKYQRLQRPNRLRPHRRPVKRLLLRRPGQIAQHAVPGTRLVRRGVRVSQEISGEERLGLGGFGVLGARCYVLHALWGGYIASYFMGEACFCFCWGFWGFWVGGFCCDEE